MKATKTKTTTTKEDANNTSNIVIQNKTRQQAEKHKYMNIFKQKANKPIAKNKNQKLT